MAQMPRWYRRQLHEHKLANVFNNPYADVSSVAAARKAVNLKLEQEDREYERSQQRLTNNFLSSIG